MLVITTENYIVHFQIIQNANTRRPGWISVWQNWLLIQEGLQHEVLIHVLMVLPKLFNFYSLEEWHLKWVSSVFLQLSEIQSSFPISYNQHLTIQQITSPSLTPASNLLILGPNHFPLICLPISIQI